MATKSIKTRIQNKHAVEADWNQAANFVPLAGELIVYDVDEKHTAPRVKVGDGILQTDGTVKGTTVKNLPFLDAEITSGSTDPSTDTVGQYYFKYSE